MRKDPKNFGTQLSEEKFPPGSQLAYETAIGHRSVVMPERLIRALLKYEAERLAAPANEEDLRRFFAHFFDPSVTENERESYITSFQRSPPVVRLGYPRTGSEFPCFAIVLESDTQTDDPLGSYLGETAAGDPVDRSAEYVGSMFEQTYGIYVYAQHPDKCLYLYHFAKMVMLGSWQVLAECGFIDPHYDGNEMIPQETYLPENMFVRRLAVSGKSLQTVPSLLTPDPAHIRVTGIWADDIVVSGLRGGVHPIDPNEDDNG